ncbi:protein SPIRRIG [Selaginella moellendorffii]|uniref:protein SPIRRIG n=1 Tax=Selaginella moellendorffii TaxID=88036 RepID=UPI000D1CA8EE|nr:protein SPIRRIG [Selaginella moellendorffii]|eukprot:XP_024543043.1 protein SPIRRIG [Selaginella moellendorffii]
MKWTSLLNKVNFSSRDSPGSQSGRRSAAANLDGDANSKQHYESEQDFKRFWEEFRCGHSDKEKQEALEMALSVFCKLSRRHQNPAQLATSLVDTRQFAFVVARAFIADVDKIKSSTSQDTLAKSLIQGKQEETANMLYVLESLVSPPLDVQPLLDAGLLSCLVHVLYSFLDLTDDFVDALSDDGKRQKLQVEGEVVHILKALGSHLGAAQSLADDDSLQMLFAMVIQRPSSVHLAQLHRHVLQILGNVLSSDDGSCAHYIHRHQLVKMLLRPVKEFTCESGDGTLTVGVVSLLLTCVEVSCRPGAGGINLREDLQNAHGYQLLVQFGLSLASPATADASASSSLGRLLSLQDSGEETSSGQADLSTSFLALLDTLIDLAQVGPVEESEPGDLNYNKAKAVAIQSRCFPIFDGTRFKSNESLTDGKVRDLFAVQVLQDIFLKSGNLNSQVEVLDRLLRLLASHMDNYLVVQELRTLSLFILNMPALPRVLQGQLLKVLEHVVTVVNQVPEQELLSLCCLLQQSLSQSLRSSILSFLVKILSFDPQYKKVLREVGVLDLLVEDLKTAAKISQKKDGQAVHIFEDKVSLAQGWDCLLSLLKRNEANQTAFRKAHGFDALQPLLLSDIHRTYVLRILSCLISEDTVQSHPEELKALLGTTRAGEGQGITFKAKTDILWAVFRILCSNPAAKDVFGEGKGFTLMHTVLESLEDFSGAEPRQRMEIVNALLHVVTVGVAGHSVNRIRLNDCVLSHAFSAALLKTGLICGDYEDLILDLFFDICLEKVQSPARNVDSFRAGTWDNEFISVDERRELFNAGLVQVALQLFDDFSPKAQLKVVTSVEALSEGSLVNKDRLTLAGCLKMVLEILTPSASYSPAIWMHGMQIVKLLGSYRISSFELRALLRYMWQCRDYTYGQVAQRYIEALEGVVRSEESSAEISPAARFMDFSSRRNGHASVRISLGDRSWPPAAGYSFMCWLRFTGIEGKTKGGRSRPALRIFMVESVEEKGTVLAELYLNDSGLLTLATGPSSLLAFKGVRLEEGLWYHIVIVHNKPNALAGLFQSSVASLYVNGNLRHTGKLGYSPSSFGKTIQAVIGIPPQLSDVSSSTWQMTGCYLFEEVLPSQAVCLVYALGRGYRGLFQDTDLLRFVPYEACGGGNLAVLEGLETASAGVNVQKGGDAAKYRIDGSGAVWELERLVSFWIQLSNKKLIFSFDGTPGQTQTAGQQSIVNLVEPLSAAASPLGGLPRIGRLVGDVEILNPCSFGDSMRKVGGMAVVLALVEAAETGEMLHLALSLLVRVLYYNPRNTYDMLACRGYHLLVLFLHRRIRLFEVQDLELLFQIAACEASFYAPPQSSHFATNTASSGQHPLIDMHGANNNNNVNGPPADDQVSSGGSVFDATDIGPEDIANGMSEFGSAATPEESLNCVVLSNPDMMEHVLMDWTLWSRASVPIQLSLLGFIERLVAVHRYRNHNLATLRRLNIVQHLLVTLQRGDIEVPVIEKLVVLLGILLEDGFLPSELKYVADFVVMSFNPPEVVRDSPISREAMGLQVIVRNVLLEMLIDLQMTINAEDVLETWHKTVSSRIITFVLDEAAHPTTMRWIMTLLGVCISSSPTFSIKFRASGGYQAISHVLSSFYDAPEIYYILFCLMFGKPVYPRQPEVRLLDFHALMPGEAIEGEILFTEFLDSILLMFKAAFDKMSLQSQIVQQTGDFSQFPESLAAGFANGFKDIGGDLQSEALLHKTYAARLMGGEAAAPSLVTSLLRFMVDLAKMHRPFSTACRRLDFLEGSVELYFSCARSAAAIEAAQGISAEANNQSSYKFSDDFQVINQKVGAKADAEEPAAQEVELLAVSTKSSPIDIMKPFQADESIDNFFVFPSTYAENTTNGDDTHSQRSSSFSNAFTESSTSAFVTLPLSPTTSDNSRNEAGTPLPSRTPGNNLASWVKSTFPSDTPAPSRSASSIPSRTTSIVSASTHGPASDSDRSSIQDDKQAFPITKKLLLQLESAGSGGGPCSSGATAVLDLVAEVLADALADQLKATPLVEATLEAVPLHIGGDIAVVFQGLCLYRVMNFLERRLQRDDEEAHKKLDRARWSSNLDAFSSLVVDRVYMGAFSDSAGVLKVLEFLLSMLQLANKHGRVEEAMTTGRSLLSLARGGFKQLEPFVQSLLRNTNRMLLFCFLPSPTTNEELTSSNTGLLAKGGLDITLVLQLLISHKKLVLCPGNVDSEFLQCLLVNIVPLLQDPRQAVRTLAVDACKVLLHYRKEALEDILVLRHASGEALDVFHGGFDKLLASNSIGFYTWFDDAHDAIGRVLEQRASLAWMQFIGGAARFNSSRLKNFEVRRKREMGRRMKDASKADGRHWEQMLERRVALDMVRDSLSAELRLMRQVKYGWVIHAENEWQDHIQQLMHERGLWPVVKSVAESDNEWQLCSTEGPYRMRKKLVRCKPKIDIAAHAPEEAEAEVLPNGQAGFAVDIENPDYDSFFHIFSLGVDSPKKNAAKDYLESFDEEDTESKGREDDANSLSTRGDGTIERSRSAINDSGKSPESIQRSKSDAHGTAPGSSPTKTGDFQLDDADDQDFQDDGEYLIAPYLERGEKIRFRYNCERVAGLDKHDGIFLIGERCLYIIENYFIDSAGRICEKGGEGELSVIDQALGVKTSISVVFESTQTATWSDTENTWPGGKAWACSGGAWGKEKLSSGRQMPHSWRMWKLDSVHELLKRWYQLRPVAIELFSMDGCNDLLVFHKEERDEVFKNLLSINLPRSSRLETAISGVSKLDSNEGGRLFKTMAKSFSKRWQNGEISNFQYLMHLNTLAGRGYNDLTQYPVFPWVLADYESEELNLSNPTVYRRLDKPMGALSLEREDVFRKRYDNWDDPEIPKFHYGSHYSSAGTVLFYLIRLPPFSQENLKLQGGQFDHADRLFTNIRDTWLSASQGNTADVKELVPEFFYLPEFLENKFDLDLGTKQSGEKVDDVVLPPWAKGSAREFIRKHREALESQYVSENLHHWIDLIFGYRQRGQAAVDATNVFYYLTYEGAVDIDSVRDPALKASTLAQINHFGQTPRQLFLKPHPGRKCQQKVPFGHVLRSSQLLAPQEIRNATTSIAQIVVSHDKVFSVGHNRLLKPRSYSKYIAWGFPDNSLRFVSYDQDRLLSTHEGLHDGTIVCAGFSRDGRTLVTGGEDGVASVWRLRKDGVRNQRRLHLQRALCAHSDSVTCLSVCQPYNLVVTGSSDCTVIFWDLSTLEFVRQLPQLPAPASAVHTNEMTGEIVTAAGTMLVVWSVNGDCLAALNVSRLASEAIVSITSPVLSDWMETGWYVTGHQNGAIKLWRIDYAIFAQGPSRRSRGVPPPRNVCFTGGTPEYHLVLHKVLKSHTQPVTALHLSPDLKQLYSGDAGGHVTSWVLSTLDGSSVQPETCPWCQDVLDVAQLKRYCRNCGKFSCQRCGESAPVVELGYVDPVPICWSCSQHVEERALSSSS